MSHEKSAAEHQCAFELEAVMRALVVISLLCLSCSPSLTPIGQHRQAVTTSAIPSHVTWLIDKSGSMLTNVSTAPPCPSTIGDCGPGSACPSGCPTRMDLLNQAVAATALDGGSHNLVVFPQSAANSCGPPGESEATRDLSFGDLQAEISQLQPGGGTPTADALLFVEGLLSPAVPADGGSGPSSAGNDLVLLFTDGVPNCNPTNPNNCSTNQCVCTTGICTMASGLCSLGCLDDLATLNAANSLFEANVDLMILPIAIDVGSAMDQVTADSLFSQMKSTVQRSCASNADCVTGGMCNSNGFCSGSQWKFSNAIEFAPAAARIHQEVQVRGRCYWSLGSSVTADRIEVHLGNNTIGSDQWELRSPTVLRIKGDACTQLVNDSTLSPSVIEL